ncbi:MAG: SUMF1/EgtB/PvdO family nonheme iron enzyme [Flavobacteriales bacterium]|nr:SUMF1/EgtB/PvdO family nonheme iron enzyme [Flavobacteriales bacterium]
MKKILFLGTIVALLSSCGGSGNGELIGSQDRQIWNPTDPYGMVFVPQGSFVMGPSDQDVPFANVTTNKRVSIGAFYMDETEITNNEYRQFVNWVRDSIIRTALIENADPDVYGVINEETGEYKINWNVRVRHDDDDVRFALESAELYYTDYNTGRNKLDTRKLIYSYKTLDLSKAAKKSSRDDDSPESYITENEINIFPDTLTWMHDYAYSFNKPYSENYFWHVAYDDYPVVGVNWHQAVAFTKWRTKMMNEFLRSHNEPTLPEFRLPTESEWEYASRGGLDESPYPWGGPYTRNLKGCFLANFKPLRGNYTADGGIKAIKVMSYNPNGFGLYDMAGNVAEWTSNIYDESSASYSHDMNGDYVHTADEGEEDVMMRKVIRGGSWKDISYFIQNSTRSYEYQDTSKCYVGFRCAVDFLGRDKQDFQ